MDKLDIYYDTGRMIQMLDQMLPTRTFLKSTFFNNVVTNDQEYVTIDIRKGKRRLAPFVAQRIGSKTVERIGYKTQVYKPPLVALDMIVTADDLVKRQPNEAIFGAKPPMARMAEIMARDLRDLDEQITRREEWMCAQVLMTGKIPMIGEGVNDVLDLSDEWHFEELKDMESWDDPINPDITGQLRKFQRQISQRCGMTARIGIVGSNAIEKLYHNQRWREEMKFFQVSFANYTPQAKGEGVTFVAHIPSLNLDLYTYNEWYLDSDGVEKPMIDPNTLLLGSAEAYTSMMYGCVIDPSLGAFATPRVPKSWIQQKPGERFLQISSRPMPVPHQLDAFMTIKVCSDAPLKLANGDEVAGRAANKKAA